MHIAGERSGRKTGAIGKAGFHLPHCLDERNMLDDPPGTANIPRHERSDGSQADGRDGKRNKDFNEGKSRAPVQVFRGRLTLKGRWLEQPLFPPSAT